MRKIEENSLVSVISKLEKLYMKFNTDIFYNELQIPIISVAPGTNRKNKIQGWCSEKRVWKSVGENIFDDRKGRYEINICSDFLGKPFEEICLTLLHQMCHQLNAQNGIKDTSRSGAYHNASFKETAERHGLITEKTDNGWSNTTFSVTTKKYIDNIEPENFTLYRWEGEQELGTKEAEEPKKRKVRLTKVFVCPSCHNEVKCKAKLDIICEKCNEKFVNIEDLRESKAQGEHDEEDI